MNLWRVDMTIKQAQRLHLEEEEYLWIQENPETILIRMENQDVSTAIYMDIWPKNAEGLRKKERRGSATNVTNKNTQPMIVNLNSR